MDRIFAIPELYEKDLQVTHPINTNYKMTCPHFHDGCEINVTLTDNLCFHIEDRKYIIDSGTMTIINNDELHYNYAPDNVSYERYVIYFMPEYITEFSSSELDLLECFKKRKNSCIKMTEKQLTEFCNLSNRLLEYISTNPFAADIRKKLVLSEILVLCNEVFSGYQADCEMLSSVDNRITEYLDYIAENLSEDLTLDALSKHFYISKSHLNNLFNKALGISPIDYVISRRIMKSREFLRQGYSVSQSCEFSGFSDESHFIRTFKKHSGITPKQYSIRYFNHIGKT